MIIRQLELKNFLSHEHSLISFNKGVTVIYGHNGAGKSSIIDAIKFALFGDQNRGNIADLIRRGAKELEVDLDFDIGPDKYRITRIMSMGKSGINKRDATLTRNSSVLSTTVNSVNDTVGGILDIDKSAFLNSVFVEQGEIDSLISKTSSEREKTFSRILGLDLLGKYADDLGKLSRDTSSRLQLLSHITDNLEIAENSVAEKEKLVNHIITEIDRVSGDKKSVSDLMEAINLERQNLQSSLSDLKSLATTVENRKRTITDTEEKISRRTAEINSLNGKVEELTKAIDRELLSHADLIMDYFAVWEPLASRKDFMNDLKERIAGIEKMSSQIKALEPSYRNYMEMEKKLSELRTERTDLEMQDSEFRSAENRIKEIESNISEMKGNFNLLSRKLGEKFGTMEFTRASVQELRSDIEDENSALVQKVQEIKANVGRYNTELREIEERISNLPNSSKCPLCLQDLSEEHRKSIRLEYDEKAGKTRQSLENLHAAKRKLDEKVSMLNEKIAVVKSPEVENGLLALQTIDSLEREKLRLEDSIGKLKTGHQSFIKLLEEISSTEKKMNALRQAYDRYRSYEITLSTSDADELSTRLMNNQNEIDASEKKLKELADAIGHTPDHEEKNTVREMKEKEKGLVNVREGLLALNTAQSSDHEKVEELKLEIFGSEEKLSSYGEIENKFNDISGKYDAANSKLHEIIGTESSLKTQLESEKRSIQELKSNVEKLKDEQEKLEKARKGIAIIDRLRSCFDRDGIQKAIRKDSAVYITNKVREYSASFNLDFDDVKIDEDMAIEVSQNGNLESIDMLSGGEKVALAIALRLSLATYVMESIKTIVMDEPTTYLDEDRRNNLKDIIQYTFRGEETPVPQMVIVTHHKEIGSVADNVFEISKKNGVSQVAQG